MTEAEWLGCGDARDMITGVDKSVGNARKLRLFAVACCRCSRQLLLNRDHRAAVDLAERFADGLASEAEFAEAYGRTNELALRLDWGQSEQEIRRWAEAVAVLNATRLPKADAADAVWQVCRAAHRDVNQRLVALLRDIVGNPFRPINPPWLLSDPAESLRTHPQFARWYFAPSCRTPTVLALAQAAYDERALPSGELDADRLAVLADALEDAGATGDILAHLRDPGPHVRGCWALDLALGRE